MKPALPLVTALINAYNYARYVPFAINSVLAQTYRNFEIVVVDDGSTDNTAKILREFGDRIRVIRTPNGGQAHTFNVGIPAAVGELVMLLDADDIWLPTKMERVVEEAARNPSAAMIYHRFQNIDKQGTSVGVPQPFRLIEGDLRHQYLKAGGSWWSPITSTLTFRAEHIKRALPIPTLALREGADTLLADFCVVSSNVVPIPDCLTLRRLHGANWYATGRDDVHLRSREVRQSDIRRIEWRMFVFQTILERTGYDVKINLNKNTWRMLNKFWLGEVSFMTMARILLAAEEMSLKKRWEQVKWLRATRSMYAEYDRDAIG